MKTIRSGESFMLTIMLIQIVIVLFFISPDSPTHYFFDRCDSANFFMCGKAWMNGMTPYVDFTDSKGPLLWLIYGVGYLVSPRSYTGVLLLSIIAYTITCYYTYKISSVFLKDKIMSLQVSLLMTAVYLCPLYHYETRAEDFCLPFVVYSLFCTCDVLYSENVGYVGKKHGMALGLCIAATLLVKYTIAAMICVFVPFLLVELYKRRQNIWNFAVWMVVGGLYVLLPFVVTFLIEGNIAAFIEQYFLITFNTIREMNSTRGGSGLHDFILPILQNAPVILAFVLSATVPLVSSRVHRYRFFPLFSAVVFILICIPNAKWSYYFSIVSPFVMFAVIPFVRMLNLNYAGNSLMSGWCLCITVFFVTIIGSVACNYHYYYYSVNSLGMMNLKFQNDNPVRQAYMYYSDVISHSHPKPRIIYVDGQCFSEYGVAAEALPGCRDWSRQNGASKEMIQSAWKAVERRQADFVVATGDESAAQLLSLGYVQVPDSGISSSSKIFTLPSLK